MERPKIIIPKHWVRSSWEEKARENPLFAIMTTPDMADAKPEYFDEAHIEKFKEKGRVLFNKHVSKAIDLSGFKKQDSLIVEFGCGVGRILNKLVEEGISCAGVDISPTMLDHCRRMVPGVKSLHLCHAETAITDLDDEAATVVFSYAVLQHISSLNLFENSITEMCRILKPRGILAIQVNCEDFVDGDLSNPNKTENFESYSLHYKSGQLKTYMKHKQDNWSGVYIGIEKMKELLGRNRIEVQNIYYHNPKKLRALWVMGRKKPI
jgi:SAM-dependent methyltransferase